MDLSGLRRTMEQLEQNLGAGGGGGGGGSGRSYNQDEVQAWSAKDVSRWLQEVGFGQYTDKFEDLEIDGSILSMDLDQHQLQEDLEVNRADASKMMDYLGALKRSGELPGGKSSDGGGGGSGGDVQSIFDRFMGQLETMVNSSQDTLEKQLQKLRQANRNKDREIEDLNMQMERLDRGGGVSYDELDDVRRETRQATEAVEALVDQAQARKTDLSKANNMLQTEIDRRKRRIRELEDKLRRSR